MVELSNYIVTDKGELKYSYYYQEMNRLVEDFMRELLSIMKSNGG
jgi:hypothetical protein